MQPLKTHVCSRLISIFFALVLIFSLTPSLLTTVKAADFPANFSESFIAGPFAKATTMRFAPDGRLFVAEQNGKLWVIKDGVLLPTPAIDLDVDSQGERGLIGIAFDPNFASNQYIYLYYTPNTTPVFNRISRFKLNGDSINLGTEDQLMDLDPLSGATNHNGGALNFGADNKLYVAVGDNANSSHSQTLENRHGKILRLNKDGTIPTDNPFYGEASGDNRAIWALGLRNPYNFAVQPGTGRILLNDVGQVTYEEINDGIAGANYGWPQHEGPEDPPDPATADPLYFYPHDDGCSIIGATFYNPTTITFPNDYVGDYFFGDYCDEWIRHYDLTTDNTTEFTPNTTGGDLIDIQTSANGDLYYLTRGSSGGVFAVTYNDSSPHDLIDNGGFETPSGSNPNQPANWIGKNLVSDRVRCNTATKIFAHTGDCAYRFRGAMGENARLQQSVNNPALVANDTLTLRVWVQTENVIPDQNTIQLTVTYDAATKDKQTLTISQAYESYTELTLKYTLTGVPTKVRTRLSAKSTTGKWLVDDVALIINEIPAGSSAGVIPLPLPPAP